MNVNHEDLFKLKRILKGLYSDTGPERVGFIMDHQLVEVRNISATPEEGFSVDPADTIKYTEELKAQATWHTHPGSLSNLSGEDYRMFKAFPAMLHFIVGKDAVRCYSFDKNKQSLVEI